MEFSSTVPWISSKAKYDKTISPRDKFASILSEPTYYSQLKTLFDPKMEIDDWKLVHCYFAFIYALRTTAEGNKFIHDRCFDIYHAEKRHWEAALNTIFMVPSLSNEFKKCTERFMQSADTRLAIPVRLLLNRLFQHRAYLRGCDFGCGLHIDLPLLASDYLPPGYQFPDSDIQNYNYPVPLSVGIGIDLYPPDLEWVKVCTSSLALTKKKADVLDHELEYLLSLRMANVEKFSTVTADIFQFTSDKVVDFIITKKMRYQHGEDKQDLIKHAISRSLKEDGYWITIAEENYHTDGHAIYLKNETDEIWSYQKQKGILVRISDRPLIEVSRRSGIIVNYDTKVFMV